MNKIHNEPTEYQKLIAKKLEIDISNDTLNVAGARILEVVQCAINPNSEISDATSKQIDFGNNLGLELEGDSKEIASARIKDVLNEKNAKAIERMKLKPGDNVETKEIISFNGKEK